MGEGIEPNCPVAPMQFFFLYHMSSYSAGPASFSFLG